ncbi:reverse transcriptase domain-containing protein [Alicyclobacillus mengziensis]|uniref:Reverse transcriptase n=1 Tax=Alicyclobacillus mengziensis TaxID=2931921 RepID=A0A9X7W1I6_9BACL|nr:reverse transcriptase domain-containing protein [Alicyclobacillus mengziensis]QSO48599.1 reverse transcriptase [Alicyclobacillus mengziensis]
MSTELHRVTQRAKEHPQERFTALSHHLDEELLADTWQKLNKRGAVGVDKVTVAEYASDLETNIRKLVDRQREHSYRAPNVRRVHIPKPGQPSKLRPLGIPTLEDRLLQSATARILSAVYEADFLDCSYGFRPGRNPHQAIARVRTALLTEPYEWVCEADIRGFFDNLDHKWLIRMLELRIGDPWILRLIKKWLVADIQQADGIGKPIKGSPQGGLCKASDNE